MRTLEFCRFALGICAVAVIIGGCGSHSDNGGALLPPSPAGKLSHHSTFNYTGKEQEFKVPSGVKLIDIVARGGGGAGGSGSEGLGSRGGRVHASIPVTAGETLAVYVGGGGSGTTGGFNGGGAGGHKYGCNCPGFGGGGRRTCAKAVRT